MPKKASKGVTISSIYTLQMVKNWQKENDVFVNFYCGSFVYKSDKSLEYISHSEGLAQKNGSLFDYQYNLTDHLGNVRNVLNASGTSVQSNDYYPFGLTHNVVSNFAKNKYLYNGKEAQDETIGGTIYNVLDYHARSYDPVIGRMTEPDPMLEKYISFSPFAYCINNPLRFIDIDGQEPGDIVVLFTGADFGQGPTLTTNNIFQNLHKNQNGETILKYSSAYFLSKKNGTQSAYDNIVSNYQINPEGKIIIYGYSYGGVLANHLSKKLEELGIPVELLVTVDAENGWGSDNVDRTIGDNVIENDNSYQENTSVWSDPTLSHGGKNSGKPNQVNNYNKSNDIYKGEKINHMNIDDATVDRVSSKMLDILNRMGNKEKKELTKEEINNLFK